MTIKLLGSVVGRVRRVSWSSVWTMPFATATQSMPSFEVQPVTTLVGQKASRCLGGPPKSNSFGTYMRLLDLSPMTRLLSRYACHSTECLAAF